MAEQTVHLVTPDERIALEMQEAATHWDPAPAVVTGEMDRLSPADVVVLDADAADTRLEELLEACRAARTVVIGSPGREAELSHAHALYGSEFLLKDEHGHFTLLVPTLVRKLLRDEDRDETTRDIIRSSEERYRNLVEALPDIVYRIDPNGYFTFINGSVRRLGYEPADLIGRHFSTIVDASDLPRVSRRKVLADYRGHATGAAGAPGLFDERRTADRRTAGLEIRLRPRGSRNGDGEDEGAEARAGDAHVAGDTGAAARPDPAAVEAEPMVASLIAYGEITATGQYRTDTARRHFVGTVGIIRDITDRKRSQRRLRQLSFAIEHINTAVSITDGFGRVEYANPSFFRMNDIRPELVFGAQLEGLYQGYLEEETPGELAAALTGARVWERDRIVWTRAGESKWCWLRIYPVFDLEQQVSQYLMFQDDVSERKRRELELAETAEAHQDTLRMVHHRVGATLRALGESLDGTAGGPGAQHAGAQRDDSLARRLHAQILVHELVYESGVFDRLDLARFFRALPDTVLSRISRRGRLEVGLTEHSVGLNTALPLALAAAECLAAVWPHADAHMQTLTLELETAGEVSALRIGQAASGADGAQQTGLPRPGEGARRIIETLLSHVDGELKIEDRSLLLTFRTR
jgi:PAS domain S-box-containing protein